jgi:hypothetical protein
MGRQVWPSLWRAGMPGARLGGAEQPAQGDTLQVTLAENEVAVWLA